MAESEGLAQVYSQVLWKKRSYIVKYKRRAKARGSFLKSLYANKGIKLMVSKHI